MMTEAARIASIDSLQSLLTDCRNTGDQLSAQIKKLLRDTTQMGNSIRQYQSMLSTNMTEQEKLNALLSQKKNELSERERTINELQDMINAQNEKVKQLLNSVKDALLGFSTDELTVREKDGKCMWQCRTNCCSSQEAPVWINAERKLSANWRKS